MYYKSRAMDLRSHEMLWQVSWFSPFVRHAAQYIICIAPFAATGVITAITHGCKHRPLRFALLSMLNIPVILFAKYTTSPYILLKYMSGAINQRSVIHVRPANIVPRDSKYIADRETQLVIPDDPPFLWPAETRNIIKWTTLTHGRMAMCDLIRSVREYTLLASTGIITNIILAVLSHKIPMNGRVVMCFGSAIMLYPPAYLLSAYLNTGSHIEMAGRVSMWSTEDADIRVVDE